jgi:hypothetical protein
MTYGWDRAAQIPTHAGAPTFEKGAQRQGAWTTLRKGFDCADAKPLRKF